MSGRLDSNQRPPEPHSGALAKLRHAPIRGPLGTATYNVDVLRGSVKAAGDRLRKDLAHASG